VANGRIPLDDSVKLIMFQFSFSNKDLVPLFVRWETPETAQERKARAARKADPQNGVEEVIPATMNASLWELFFSGDLATAGYELVDAFYKPRQKPDRSVYRMVRFTFCRFVRVTDEKFKNTLPLTMDVFRQFCRAAMWRVRASINPFYEDGKLIAGQRAVSVNLEVRTPLFEPDGKPIVQWQKDAADNRVGTAPVPLAPDYELRVKDDALELVPAS
jgi:hypothetical protein